ncbi:hypothetical protein DFH07DRAFT_938062 [Mycena maculata]|uniref:Uncharacterized protein n=1 Tax=Mycena maculata TaxID=230809 RepID=A0AAD7NQ65_9AGAR|nr:hypothetical protein DFH07DRAFT_938062 [Mycena maculata]
MSICIAPPLLSSYTQTQDFVTHAPANARKPRPVGIIFDESFVIAQNPVIHSYGVSADFDPCPISSMSEVFRSSQSSDDTTKSTTVAGFGRKRHSVLPTVPGSSEDVNKSTIVGFGRRRHHHRHSIAVAPSYLIAQADRKLMNRRSLPNPVLADPQRKRVSLDLSGMQPPVFTASTARVLGAARRVSQDILGASRQPPKPLLLAQQVQARESIPGRVRRRLVSQIRSVASSRPVQLLVSHFLSEPRLKPLKMGRALRRSEEHMYVGGNFEENRIPPSLITCLIVRFIDFYDPTANANELYDDLKPNAAGPTVDIFGTRLLAQDRHPRTFF